MAGVGWVYCRYVRLAAVPYDRTPFHYRSGSFRGISAKRCHSATDPYVDVRLHCTNAQKLTLTYRAIRQA